jgi:hypothetical protein
MLSKRSIRSDLLWRLQWRFLLIMFSRGMLPMPRAAAQSMQ